MKKVIFLIVFLLVSLIGYAQVPTPNLAQGQILCVGENHYYGDQVLDPTSTYSFTISGGQPFTIVGQQINVTWNTVGTYTITMIETNAAGCQFTTTATITVSPAGIAILDPIVVCEEGSTQLITGTNLGVNPVFSGPGITSNTFNPTGLAPGTYNYTVTSTNANGCPITGTGTITITPLPTGTIYTD